MFTRNFPAVLLLIVFLASPIPAFAWQSGTRGPVPASPGSSIGQSFAAPVQSTPTLSPSFSAPQEFPVPAPDQFGSGFMQNQFQNQNGISNSPLMQPSQAMPATGATMNPVPVSSGGQPGGPGIPASSLVDPIFQISDPNSPYVVDHSAWDGFLARYVVTDSVGINRVRYGQVNCQDRAALQCYLNQLQGTDIRTLNRNEQLAFWFNLYNARTVSLVIDNYPIRSIRQIKQKLTDFVGPFDDEGAVNVLGKSLSLNDIESGIIRPVWNDPRIHYALNCASYGCPNLAARAWAGHDIDARLNQAASDYINSNRGVKRGLFGVKVSKIYKWYSADFGGSDQAVLNHISQYADRNTCSKLCGQSKILGYFYDWSLNDGKISRPRLLESIRR